MQTNLTKNTKFSDRLKKIIDNEGVTAKEFAERLGYSRAQSIYDFLNDKVNPSFSFFQAFSKAGYSEFYNFNWLIDGEGEMLVYNGDRPDLTNILTWQNEKVSIPEKTVSLPNSKRGEAAQKNLETNIELIKSQNLVDFRHLGEDRYLIICPLVRTEAFRAYPDNFEDIDFISQLQKHAVAVDDLQFGEYMSFEAPIEHHGGSLEDFIGEGWIVTGKKIEKSTWRRGISFRKFPTYIVVVRHGILLLHVTDYDRDEQAIRFSGPENEHYPNELIPFDDILELYSVVAATDLRK